MDQTVTDHKDQGALPVGHPLYAEDFYAWAVYQSDALREGRVSDFDLPNLIDEVGSIARWEVRRLVGRLERLCHQMLLWDFGRLPRTCSRAAAIANQRRRVEKVLARCPSLQAYKLEALERGFEFGRFGALIEDECLPEADLPTRNPYTWESIMGREIAAREQGGADP